MAQQPLGGRGDCPGAAHSPAAVARRPSPEPVACDAVLLAAAMRLKST